MVELRSVLLWLTGMPCGYRKTPRFQRLSASSDAGMPSEAQNPQQPRHVEKRNQGRCDIGVSCSAQNRARSGEIALFEITTLFQDGQRAVEACIHLHGKGEDMDQHPRAEQRHHDTDLQEDENG